MDLWNADLTHVTFDDVVAFVRQDSPEFIRLDYKRDFSDAGGKKTAREANKEIAKDLSAFANAQGGLLLVGVAEDPKRKRHPGEIVGRPKSSVDEDTKQRVQSVVLSPANVYPPLFPRVKAIPLPDNSMREVVLIQIDESPEAPHVIDKRWEFYVRVEDQSEPVRGTPDDYERLRGRRERTIALRSALLEEGRERYRGLFEPSKVAHIYGWVTPLFPSKPLVALRDLRHRAEQPWTVHHNCFPFEVGEVLRSAHRSHGALVFRPQSPLVQEGRLRYASISEYGVIDLACNIPVAGQPQYQGQPVKGYPDEFVIRQFYMLLHYAVGFYRAVGYGGLIQAGLQLQGIARQALYVGLEGDRDFGGHAEFDDSFEPLPIELDQIEMREPIPPFLVDLLRRLRWCFGLGRRQFSDESLEQEIESMRQGVHGSEPCQCDNPKAQGDALCLRCRRQAAAQPTQPPTMPAPVAA